MKKLLHKKSINKAAFASALMSLALNSIAQPLNISKIEQQRFVDSKEITAPTGMSVSPEGDVYVSSDPNGARSGLKGVGKVFCSKDTDGDGIADKTTIFIDKIDAPRGSCYVGDTLYLLHPPFLSAFSDTDQDGIADTQKVLIENIGQGIATKRVDHAQNGVRMAIDGWLYLAIGDQGCHKATGTDGNDGVDGVDGVDGATGPIWFGDYEITMLVNFGNRIPDVGEVILGPICGIPASDLGSAFDQMAGNRCGGK